MRFLAFRNYNSITRLIKNMIYVLMSVSKNEKSVINDHPDTVPGFVILFLPK